MSTTAIYDANLRLRYVEPRAPHGRESADDPLLGLLLRRHGCAAFRIRASDMVVEADDRFFAILRRPPGPGPVAFGGVLALFETETASALSALALRALGRGGGFSATHRHRLPDGSVRLLEWEAAAAGPGEGAARHLVGVLRDATEDVEAANLLDGQKELIANLVDALPLPVAILDRRLRYVAANRPWIEDFALGAGEDLVGARHYDLFPDTPVWWRELHHIALNGERVTRDRDDFSRGDGARLTVNWVLQPWRDKTGGIGGIVVLAEILRLAREAGAPPSDRGDLARILFDAVNARPASVAVPGWTKRPDPIPCSERGP